MVNNNGANNKQPAPAKDSAQEEQQLEDMLHRLDQVHLQLRQLRSALPRMLEPLMTKQSSPQAAFAAYMQSVDNTKQEISGFQEAYLGLFTDVFQRTRIGQKNSKGIKQWRASEHPNWADPDPKRRRVS